MSEIKSEYVQKAIERAEQLESDSDNLKSISELQKWSNDLGDIKYVSGRLGVDETTFWRWCNGKTKVPKWVNVFMDLSNKCADLRQENSKLKREMKTLKRA